MIVLNQHEADEVSGGFVPVGVAIVAVRVAQIAAPYVQLGVSTAVGAAFGAWGYNVGSQH